MEEPGAENGREGVENPQEGPDRDVGLKRVGSLLREKEIGLKLLVGGAKVSRTRCRISSSLGGAELEHKQRAGENAPLLVFLEKGITSAADVGEGARRANRRMQISTGTTRSPHHSHHP